ncbi:general secretion pathway protein GspJ [Stenotrophomonas daejeonensis]|uniref:General secretion pathway protein GspJ n=1 Tax=Stenotrophomonas daejeonensis TaxID=659018 RepID=A0A0R0DZ64_9GAMM|nr:general secretion pathway protein GspJ [Stenotrophomonas daejeonensis]KRG82990.1 general secretion pathway protein GspJ [Stenotrophomonas daejeonensis]
MTRYPYRTRMGGFTLLEVLLATTLLAAGLGLGFATLRTASQMTERGEVLAQRNERIRAVSGFVRRQLRGALPMAFANDASNGNSLRFVGEPQRMRFVADLPDYLGRGGPYLHELWVEDGRLLADFAMVQAGQTVQEREPRAPELLADGLRAVRFRYRGIRDDDLGQWQDAWEENVMLPVQVSVEIEGADGSAWPPLVVTLARGEGTQPQAGVPR